MLGMREHREATHGRGLLPAASAAAVGGMERGIVDAPRFFCSAQAVRREVQEEARVEVGQVHLLGSQPWPIGRWARVCTLLS